MLKRNLGVLVRGYDREGAQHGKVWSNKVPVTLCQTRRFPSMSVGLTTV